MSGTSFYTDGETYATSYTTPGDVPRATTASQAPSAFYPDGGIYQALAEESATVSLFQQLLASAQASQAAAAASASAASTSASNASTSASAAATSASNAAGAVQAVAGTATPLVDGTAAVGTSTKWAHEDHVHPTDTSRAALASPAFSGTPTAPTAAVATSTTQLATTAFVMGQLATGTPAMDGTAAVGTASRFAREDHVHPTDTSRAALASPAFSGTPTAPTAAAGTNTTQLATTAFVLANAASNGTPIFILATGQSWLVEAKTYAWSPNPNAKVWNNVVGTDGSVGTSYTALDGTKANFAQLFASRVADANPSRKVYLLTIAFNGQPISKWLPGATSPDAFANIQSNITAAMSAAGVTRPDVTLWWQCAGDVSPTFNANYANDFGTMMSRFWADTTPGFQWFPQETPVIMLSGPTSAVSGASGSDNINVLLAKAASNDPGKRRYIYTPDFSGATYWDGADVGHPTAAGYVAMAGAAFNAYANGPGRNTLQNVVVNPSTGSVVVGNPSYTTASLAINNSTTAPVAAPTAGTMLHSIAADGAANFLWMDSWNGGGNEVVGRMAGGTNAVPTATPADKLLVGMLAQANNGSIYTGTGAFQIYTNGVQSGSNNGSYGLLYLIANGSTALTQAARWDVGKLTISDGTETAILDTAAWTPFTVTVTASSGTFTTVSATGRYKKSGKTVQVQIDVTMTTVGTAAGLLKVSLPFTAAAFNFAGVAKEWASTGKSGVAQVLASTNQLVTADSTGASFIANGNKVNLALTYEIP